MGGGRADTTTMRFGLPADLGGEACERGQLIRLLAGALGTLEAMPAKGLLALGPADRFGAPLGTKGKTTLGLQCPKEA